MKFFLNQRPSPVFRFEGFEAPGDFKAQIFQSRPFDAKVSLHPLLHLDLLSCTRLTIEKQR